MRSILQLALKEAGFSREPTAVDDGIPAVQLLEGAKTEPEVDAGPYCFGFEFAANGRARRFSTHSAHAGVGEVVCGDSELTAIGANNEQPSTKI